MSSRRHQSRRSRKNNKVFFWKRLPRWVRILLLFLGGIVYAWAFYYFFVSPTGFRWRALYGDAEYPDGYEIHGIDISHYQGDIDWNKLKMAKIGNSPVKFILIKSTEGSNQLDENFNDNFYQAREYGFIRGAYHFWSNKSTPRTGLLFLKTSAFGRWRFASCS